jgi:hypothetical protein
LVGGTLFVILQPWYSMQKRSKVEGVGFEPTNP